jgi:flagellar biosynthesis/type III secretory pathway protein FliH
MKCSKIVMTVVATLLFAVVAVAAEEGQPKEKGKGPRLSQEQKDKLAKVRDDFEAKKQQIHEKLGEVLTDDQRRTAQETLENAKQSGKSGRELYQSLEASLKLTDEQKQKMEPAGKELQSLVSDTLKQVMDVLSPDQKEALQKKIGAGKKGKKKQEK